MTQSANTNFITGFDTQVKLAYQDAGKLRNTVKVRKGVKGSSYEFFKMASVAATQMVRGTDVTPATALNPAQTKAVANLADYQAAAYSYVMDINKLSYDEKGELAVSIGKGMGRNIDKVIIDALAASGTTNIVASTVGSSAATGFNLDKLVKAKALLDAQDVDESGRFLVISSAALEQALLNDKMTSADYAVVKSLANGELNAFCGFNIIRKNGLPLASGTRDCYAYHIDSMGLAIGADTNTRIDYDPRATGWLINSTHSVGAVAIDKAGIVKIQVKE